MRHVRRLLILIGKYHRLMRRHRRARRFGTFRIEHLRPGLPPRLLAWHDAPFAKAELLHPYVDALRSAGTTGEVVVRLSTSDEVIVRWSLELESGPVWPFDAPTE